MIHVDMVCNKKKISTHCTASGQEEIIDCNNY